MPRLVYATETVAGVPKEHLEQGQNTYPNPDTFDLADEDPDLADLAVEGPDLVDLDDEGPDADDLAVIDPDLADPAANLPHC